MRSVLLVVFNLGVTDDDLEYTYEAWREKWISEGMHWSSVRVIPYGWNPGRQLASIGVLPDKPDKDAFP